MGEEFIRSTSYHNLISPDLPSMRALVARMIEKDDATVLIGEVDGHLVAMLGLFTYTHPISGCTVAAEMFWWVDPNHRGALGIRMLRLGETWCRESGATVLQMIAPTERVETLYERLGYTRVEVNYQKRLT